MVTHDDPTALSESLASKATMRIAGIRKLTGFYTPLEERFERISRLGKKALGVRAAGVALITDETLWFKSIVGWRISELLLKDSLEQPMLDSGEPLIVLDTHKDLRFAKLPLVLSGPKFRFYAGYPIRDVDGEVVGTFSAFDTQPKQADETLIEALLDLGHLAERELLTKELWDAQNQLVSKLGSARRQALLDTLTRVWNRRGGVELLDSLLQESESSGERIAVCMIDIDLFKEINDKYGHPVGDQALRKIAAGIVASVRPDDIVSRHGGDEFLLIMRDAAPDLCRSVAERISANMQKMRLRTPKGCVSVTLSIGMAVTDAGKPMTAKKIIEQADQALYHTKQSGRSGATLYPDDIR
ncbi:MAG: sensor domain-containing diguanylate cyclase [Woeseiaceae bacterium]